MAAYCLSLRRYGFELADEGVLLAHMDRVGHGQVPYRDFHLGYGPALYWLHAASFAGWGPSTTTVRAGLAFTHAVRAIILATLAFTVGGRAWAAAIVLVFIAFFLPVAPGLCAPGNIPYPAWYADAVGLGALLLLVRRPGSTLLVGMLWGVVFAFKQNSGLFGLGAAALTIVLTAPRSQAGTRSVAVLLAVALLAATVALLWAHLDVGLVLVFVVPLLPLAVAVARIRVTSATRRTLLGLGLGFLLVAGSVVALMVARAGVGPVATDFLQVGADTLLTYYVPHPSLAGVLHDARGVGWLRAARLVGDASWFVILPLVHLMGALLVATGRLRSRLGVAVVAAASVGYLQLYPRMDFWHLLPLASASLVTVTLVVSALAPAGARTILVALVAVAIVRFAPTLPVLAALRTPEPVGPRIARLDVRWDLLRDDPVRRVPEVVEAVRGHARVAGFPALGAVNFALGRPSPWRHDYFFPGRPTASEERELAAQIVHDPPDVVVMLDEPRGAFATAFDAHPGIVAALDQALVEERRIGPYRVLVPRTGR